MASYVYETITAAQAMAYAGTDTLAFQRQGVSASQVSVLFNAGDVTNPATVSIVTEGFSLKFGTPIEGETDITFADGSILYIGTPGNDANPRPGAAGNDAFFGNSGDDAFVGGAGNDLFQGNQGNDTLSGGDGNDTMYGGQDSDQLNTGDGTNNFAQGNMGDDTITGGTGDDRLYGGKDNDQVIGGAGRDYINGNLGNDSLSGGAGSDTIYGEDGNDTIQGGASDSALPAGGRDFLYGGAGADRFVFPVGDSSIRAGEGDQILDWESADKMTFNANAGSGTNYAETTQATFADAVAAANNLINAGTVDYVAVQIGADVVIFADTPNASNGTADVAVVLVGKTLSDVDFGNIVA